MLKVAPALLLCGALLQGDGWQRADPDYQWQFPRDHWSHAGYRTEWWYFTGHLRSTTDSTRRFGYQFTFFRVGLSPAKPTVASPWAATDVIMGHAAITDLASGDHTFSEVLYRAMPLLGGFNPPPDTVIAWSRAPSGTSGEWTLTWNGRGFDFRMRDDWQRIAFTLSTVPRKPRVFQGPNGLSQKGRAPGEASQYYSFTRLATSGTLSLRDTIFSVRGESWMDKEFGSNQLGPEQVGWDWFSLQLDDGREVMVYVLRNERDEIDYGNGTVVSPDGHVRYLTTADWHLQATRTWSSTRSGATYPARWSLELPGENLSLEIQPQLAAQENVSNLIDQLYYWEGAVVVRNATGRRVGQGYVELTGYGQSIQPALGGGVRDTSSPATSRPRGEGRPEGRPRRTR